ncbi:DHA2 family efflux MFS transporter permease subunit [Streptomyces sp. NBC_01230]|uniref:DHA2 family efflux MFS transporter permease subunit n=1 Tax=Streptomyces sp. NBC_01230 TaxID=2903784 RepID=UPI002E104DCD|nr:DHA2 family efflux MFS transporter permease subunit [Streptomyces sp. NBC_01230]
MTVGKSNSLADPADPRPPAPHAEPGSPTANGPAKGSEDGPAKSPSTGSRATAWIVSAGVFVVNLDLFIVNVAVPALGDSFDGSSLASLSWVLNAYAIVFAALLVVAGRLADRYGHRRGFLLGLAVFTAASVLCAVAPGVGWLVAARALQAAGAAALMPTSLALLLVNTAPERRPQAIRGWAAIGGIAAGLGPVIGGLLVEADWRWVFLVNVPVGAVGLVAGARLLPDARSDRAGRLPDLVGAALLTLAIGVLALGLVKADAWGWSSPEVIGSLVAAVVLAGAFWLRSARHSAPIVELAMLRTPAFAAATLAALLFSVAFAAMLLTSVLWCQQVWGYSAIRTGLAIAPGPLVVPVLAVTSGPVVRRFGAGRTAAVGCLLFAVGLGWWAVALDTAPHYAAGLLPGMLITGIGVGFALPTLVGAAAAALPPTRFATGSAVTTMARQTGSVLGVALMVTLLATPDGPAAALDAFRHGWWAAAATAVLAAAAALAQPRPGAAGRA